jgi:sporulation protein YlmC with PRC-barrel domain
MKRSVSLVAFASVLVLAGALHSAHAQESAFNSVQKALEKGSASIMDSLTALNRIKPLQNPKLMKSEAVLDRTVIDSQNKIVGRVDDFMIGADGAIAGAQISFDRLRLREPVFLSAQATSFTPSSNGFKIGLAGEQIQSMYPQLLNAIETAAGEDAMPQISLRSSIGADVYAEDQGRIGRIADVFLDDTGAKIQGFYIELEKGALRGSGVAVPLGMLSFMDNGGALAAQISQADASLLQSFAAK